MSDFEPHGIGRLPSWGRYRVPWFVTIWKDGKPDFRVIESERWVEAVKLSRCWICGDPLKPGRFAFPIGPMCTVNRVSADPATHRACAVYAAIHCPFLSDPDRVRRTDSLTQACDEASGDWGAIKRNPGVTAIWLCKRFTIERGAGTKLLVRLGRPKEVLWYHRGRRATRAEVQASFEAGCPTLEEIAESEGPEAIEALRSLQKQAVAYWPRV